MIGSSFPDAVDSWTIPEGTPWTASLLRELAASMLATQRTIGALVGNGATIGLAPGSGYDNWRTTFKRRAMMEMGEFNTSGTAYAAQVVNFAQPNKFDGNPLVFLLEQTDLSAAFFRGTRVVRGATSFTAYPPYSSPRTIRYIAVDPSWMD